MPNDSYQNGWPAPGSVHPSTRRKAYDDELPFLYAFDLIELNGDDLRGDPLPVRKATLASISAKARPGIRFNEHISRATVRPSSCTLAKWVLKASSRSARIPPTVAVARGTGSR
jgi:ATP-dependent DNA ligase